MVQASVFHFSENLKYVRMCYTGKNKYKSKLNFPVQYLIFSKERPLECPMVFRWTKLIQFFRESVTGRSADALYVGRSRTLFMWRDALFHEHFAKNRL